jgi:hypothetical protein
MKAFLYPDGSTEFLGTPDEIMIAFRTSRAAVVYAAHGKCARLAILDLLDTWPAPRRTFSASEIAEKLDVSRDSAYGALRAAIDIGRVEKVWPGVYRAVPLQPDDPRQPAPEQPPATPE